MSQPLSPSGQQSHLKNSFPSPFAPPDEGRETPVSDFDSTQKTKLDSALKTFADTFKKDVMAQSSPLAQRVKKLERQNRQLKRDSGLLQEEIEREHEKIERRESRGQSTSKQRKNVTSLERSKFDNQSNYNQNIADVTARKLMDGALLAGTDQAAIGLVAVCNGEDPSVVLEKIKTAAAKKLQEIARQQLTAQALNIPSDVVKWGEALLKGGIAVAHVSSGEDVKKIEKAVGNASVYLLFTGGTTAILTGCGVPPNCAVMAGAFAGRVTSEFINNSEPVQQFLYECVQDAANVDPCENYFFTPFSLKKTSPSDLQSVQPVQFSPSSALSSEQQRVLNEMGLSSKVQPFELPGNDTFSQSLQNPLVARSLVGEKKTFPVFDKTAFQHTLISQGEATVLQEDPTSRSFMPPHQRPPSFTYTPSPHQTRGILPKGGSLRVTPFFQSNSQPSPVIIDQYPRPTIQNPRLQECFDHIRGHTNTLRGFHNHGYGQLAKFVECTDNAHARRFSETVDKITQLESEYIRIVEGGNFTKEEKAGALYCLKTQIDIGSDYLATTAQEVEPKGRWNYVRGKQEDLKRPLLEFEARNKPLTQIESDNNHKRSLVTTTQQGKSTPEQQKFIEREAGQVARREPLAVQQHVDPAVYSPVFLKRSNPNTNGTHDMPVPVGLCPAVQKIVQRWKQKPAFTNVELSIHIKEIGSIQPLPAAASLTKSFYEKY